MRSYEKGEKEEENGLVMNHFWICVEDTDTTQGLNLKGYNRYVFERRGWFTSQPKHTMVKRHGSYINI
jgi:hypothetical protein